MGIKWIGYGFSSTAQGVRFVYLLLRVMLHLQLGNHASCEGQLARFHNKNPNKNPAVLTNLTNKMEDGKKKK